MKLPFTIPYYKRLHNICYYDIIKKMKNTERKSLIRGLDKFLYSNTYSLIIFLVALIFYILKLEVKGVIVLAAIMLFVLVVHRDTMPSLFPFFIDLYTATKNV